MSIVPDLIYLKVVINEKDTKNRISVAALEKNMINKFQEIGIDVKKELSINDLLSTYKSKMLAKSDVILSKQYQLIVHDAATAVKVYTELEKIDISNVSIERVDHTKIEEFGREVKINAIKVAKEKADLLAKAINQNIGRAIYIEELNASRLFRNSVSNRNVAYRTDVAGEDINPDFEKIILKNSILVRFELK
jgi:hypothetical protein